MQFNFYHRIGCHLCDDMYEMICLYQKQHTFKINRINVDQDSLLKDKYGMLVPVLTDENDHEICHYFFDKVTFERALKKNS